MNAQSFYAHIRQHLFKGTLTQGVVNTVNAVLEACEKYQVTDLRHKAYILATCYHECYHHTLNPDWEPVREGFAKTNIGAIRAVTKLHSHRKISVNYALPEANGKSYYGRGFVQITWPANYIRLGKHLNLPLYDNPDLTLQRPVAANILVLGMKEGLFTGRKLDSYMNDKITLFVQGRRIINGLDKAELIADYAQVFYEALTKL